MYETVTPIKIFHRVPRFGDTYITDIFSDGQVHSDTAIRYVLGTIFITALLLIVFITWLLVLSFCKCLGRRAGICAGYPFETSTESLNTDLIGAHRRQRLFRFLMMMASLIIITAACVFKIKETQSMTSLLGYLYDGVYKLTRLEQLINETGDDLGNFIDTTVSLKLNITQAIKDGVCLERGNYDPINVEEVVKFFTSIQQFGNQKLIDLREEFVHTFGIVTNLLLACIKILENYVRPIYVAAPVVVLGIILTNVSILTLRNRGNRPLFISLSRVVVPVFFIVVVLLGLGSSIIGLTLVANTDICLGGGPNENGIPERTMELFVQSIGLSGIALDAVEYYVINSCEGDFAPKTYAENLVDYLGMGQEVIGDIDFLMQTDQGMKVLESACGEELQHVKGTVSGLNSSLNELQRISKSAMEILDCEKVNAIFVAIFHGAICHSLPYVFLWAFSTWSLLFIVGALIILFRGALLPTLYTIDGETAFGETITTNDLKLQYADLDTPEASYDEEDEHVTKSDCFQESHTLWVTKYEGSLVV